MTQCFYVELTLTSSFIIASGLSNASLVQAKTRQSQSTPDPAPPKGSQFQSIQEEKHAAHERRKLERKQWRKDHHHNYRFWYNNHTNPPAYGYVDRYGVYQRIH
jgi:hypothetical protein